MKLQNAIFQRRWLVCRPSKSRFYLTSGNLSSTTSATRIVSYRNMRTLLNFIAR
jgi:hypothetical protein